MSRGRSAGRRAPIAATASSAIQPPAHSAKAAGRPAGNVARVGTPSAAATTTAGHGSRSPAASAVSPSAASVVHAGSTR